MIYTKELTEIFKNLVKETNPGKTFSSIDVILKIMEKYYTEEAVEDLNLTVFLKKHFEDRMKFRNLIDDIISLQNTYENNEIPKNIIFPADSSLVKSMEVAEEEAKKNKTSPVTIISCFHVLLGVLKKVPEISDIFKKYEVGYEDLIKINDETKDVFNEINNFVMKMLEKSFPEAIEEEENEDNLEFDPGSFM